MLPCSLPLWRSSRTCSSNWRMSCRWRYSQVRSVASRGTSALVGRSVGSVAMLFSSWPGRGGSRTARRVRRSGHEAAAVHVEHGADDVARLLGDEVADGAGDLRQLRPALQLGG